MSQIPSRIFLNLNQHSPHWLLDKEFFWKISFELQTWTTTQLNVEHKNVAYYFHSVFLQKVHGNNILQLNVHKASHLRTKKKKVCNIFYLQHEEFIWSLL